MGREIDPDRYAGSDAADDLPDLGATLPALARTVGTSLGGDLVIVAHSGNAHVAVTVDRRFLRGLREGLARSRARQQVPTPLDDEGLGRGDIAIPDVVPFRSAEVHGFTAGLRDVHVVLRAPRRTGEPAAYVDLRIDPDLLRRIERHRNRNPLRRLWGLVRGL